MIDAYVPSVCAATAETTEIAESVDPVWVTIVVFAFNTLRFAEPALSRYTNVSAVFAAAARFNVVLTSLVRILHVSNVSVTATLALFTPVNAIDYLSECDFAIIV